VGCVQDRKLDTNIWEQRNDYWCVFLLFFGTDPLQLKPALNFGEKHFYDGGGV